MLFFLYFGLIIYWIGFNFLNCFGEQFELLANIIEFFLHYLTFQLAQNCRYVRVTFIERTRVAFISIFRFALTYFLWTELVQVFDIVRIELDGFFQILLCFSQNDRVSAALFNKIIEINNSIWASKISK